MNEIVLAVQDNRISTSETGLLPVESWDDLQSLLGDQLWGVPRDVAETDPSFRQLISYMTLVSESGDVLAYQRGKAGKEDRLHAMWSVGIGGHASPEDLVWHSDPVDWSFLSSTALRELYEELPDAWVDEQKMRIGGLIRISDTPVDAVHIGLWLIAVIPDESTTEMLERTENSLVGAEWMLVDQLGGLTLENWSALVLPKLQQNNGGSGRCCSKGSRCDQHCKDNDGA